MEVILTDFKLRAVIRVSQSRVNGDYERVMRALEAKLGLRSDEVIKLLLREAAARTDADFMSLKKESDVSSEHPRVVYEFDDEGALKLVGLEDDELGGMKFVDA